MLKLKSFNWSSEKFNELVGYQDNFMPTRTLDFSPVRKEKLEALVEKFGSVQKALESIGFNFGTMLSAEIERLIVEFDKDRFYFTTQGNDNSKILYFTANPNSEYEIVSIHFHFLMFIFISYLWLCYISMLDPPKTAVRQTHFPICSRLQHLGFLLLMDPRRA